jgi:hypothetical protein
MSLNFKLIGRRVKESRIQKGISQVVLIANALGVTVDHILNGNQTNDSEEYKTDLVQLIEGCTSYEKRIIYEIASATKKSLHDNKRLQFKDGQL